MIRAGADVIKIASSGGFFSPADDPKHPHFQQDELDAIVSAAADLDRGVMSHAHGPEGIKRAVRAGVRSIEHGTYLDARGGGDDGGARHLARADASPRATPPRSSPTTRSSPRRSARSSGASGGPSSTRCGWRPRPA